jgi:hypothetical protein
MQNYLVMSEKCCNFARFFVAGPTSYTRQDVVLATDTRMNSALPTANSLRLSLRRGPYKKQVFIYTERPEKFRSRLADAAPP